MCSPQTVLRCEPLLLRHIQPVVRNVIIALGYHLVWLFLLSSKGHCHHYEINCSVWLLEKGKV